MSVCPSPAPPHYHRSTMSDLDDKLDEAARHAGNAIGGAERALTAISEARRMTRQRERDRPRPDPAQGRGLKMVLDDGTVVTAPMRLGRDNLDNLAEWRVDPECVMLANAYPGVGTIKYR